MSGAPVTARVVLGRVTRRRALVAAAFVAGLGLIVTCGNDVLRAFESKTPSRSIGTTASGRLEHGKRLPSAGRNFRAYSRLGALLGRTCVHGDARATILDAYASLESEAPGHVFVLGETGWPRGGRFRPHRTHQNGMSVDFMVPLRSSDGEPLRFPTSPFRRFGYDLEFDETGRRGATRIDFEAIARHLAALHAAAGRHGLRVERIIITPEYLPLLRATPTGRTLPGTLPFMTKPAWIRHDEHYHVDFAVVDAGAVSVLAASASMPRE